MALDYLPPERPRGFGEDPLDQQRVDVHERWSGGGRWPASISWPTATGAHLGSPTPAVPWMRSRTAPAWSSAMRTQRPLAPSPAVDTFTRPAMAQASGLVPSTWTHPVTFDPPPPTRMPRIPGSRAPSPAERRSCRTRASTSTAAPFRATRLGSSTSATTHRSLRGAADALSYPALIFIASALHGLVPLDRLLHPYDVTLKDGGPSRQRRSREAWWKKAATLHNEHAAR